MSLSTGSTVSPSLAGHLPSSLADAMPSTFGLGIGLWILMLSGYVVDYVIRLYRDSKLRGYGSPAPVLRSLLPWGIDNSIVAVYSLFKHGFYEKMVQWMESVPGRTVELRMFAQSVIFTDEPENIKAFMGKEFSSFGKGEATRKIWANMIGETQIFTVDGDMWRKSKTTIAPHVSKLRNDDLANTELHAQNLFTHLRRGTAVEVYDLIDRYQLDVTTHVFFGESANSLTSTPPFRECMEHLSLINTVRMLFEERFLWVSDSWLAPKALREVNAYTDGVTDRVRRRLTSKKPEEYTMLEDFVAQGQSQLDIKQAMMSIMLGGKDPSSILITWALYQMGKNPAIMKKMQAEVLQICGDRIPTAADLKAMTYVQDVIKETFRMHHPLGVNIRSTLKTCTLPVGGGRQGTQPLAVAKDTLIIYSLMSMMRRTDIYGPDAANFRPERWAESVPDRWHFIPYNHGPRQCLGRKFGQQQMEYTLARICQEFEAIIIPPQKEQQVKVELNVKMAHPCMCIFVPKEGKDNK